MPDCVFCKIRDGQIPSTKIYEDERTLAIMDINPINSGHCLVIMKTHAPTVWDAQPADLAGLAKPEPRVPAKKANAKVKVLAKRAGPRRGRQPRFRG